MNRCGQSPPSVPVAARPTGLRGILSGRCWAGAAGLAVWTLLGVCLVLARQVEFGVGLEFDSADYVNVARNLASGQPLLQHNQERPYVAQGPLYPVLLVVAGFGVFDPLQVAGPLNAALFGTMVWVCGAFLRRRLATLPAWAQCGCAAIAVSPLLVDSAAAAMPTTAFALLIACALICVAERDLRWRRVALAAMFSALVCLTRYTGVALVAAVSVALLLPSASIGIKQRGSRAAVYATVALAPLGMWLLRNHLLTGTLTGSRVYEAVGWTVALQAMGDEMAKWVFLELPIEDWFGAGWVALVAFALALAFCVVARRKRVGAEIRYPLLVFGGFVLAHCALVVAALAGHTAFNFNPRYLAPVYIPLLVVVWLAIGAACSTTRPSEGGRAMRPRPKRLVVVVALAVVLMTWLAYQGAMHESAIVARNARGFFFDGPRWRDSEILRHLDAITTTNRVYTNTGTSAPVFFHTRTRPHWYSCQYVEFEREGDYLLWFEQVPEPCLHIGRDETFAMSGWDLVRDFADGVLLRFNAASDATLADAVWAHFVPSRQPVREAFWTLHLDARRLVYAKTPCDAADTAARFFAHVQARSNRALPPHRQDFGFDNLDFAFAHRGLALPGGSRRCVAFVELPRYPLASLRTGQFDERDERELWSARIDFDADDGAAALRPQSDDVSLSQ